jgi:hypothetical protein
MRRTLGLCFGLILVSISLGANTIVYCHAVFEAPSGCNGWQSGSTAFCVPYSCNHAPVGISSDPWRRASS